MKLYCPECQTIYEDTAIDVCPEDGARLFSLENEQEDPLLGATIDERFRVDSLLGQGGMGAVYRGVQLSVNREVAIKVLRPELLDRELALERFYRESKIISELSHPNIVRLIDFGQDRQRDLLYLVMELVNGYNLGDLLEQGRMRAALGLEIVYQVCGALTEPHRRGVIHRDLKPDNLLLVPISDGTLQVKVLDFGIARALGNNTQLTATGMVCGTPQYMAPEQAQNMDINAATDLYALGIILYEMLCGIPPFVGQNSLQVMLQHIQHTPSPLSTMMPAGALPPEIEDLVNDMLAKTPDARPTSAREVRDRIDKIRRLYDLDPVRFNPDAERSVMFESYLLPMLPVSPGGQTAHTGMLRRETGLNKRAGSSLSTDENLSLMETQDATPNLTEPLPDARRVEILADGLHAHQGKADDSARFAQDPSTGKVVSERELDARKTVPRTPIDPTPVAIPPTQTHPVSPPKKNGPLFALLAFIFISIILASGAAVVLVMKSTGSKGNAPENPIALKPDAENNGNTPVDDKPTTPDPKTNSAHPSDPDTPKVDAKPAGQDDPKTSKKDDPARTASNDSSSGKATEKKDNGGRKTTKSSKRRTKIDKVKPESAKTTPVVKKQPVVVKADPEVKKAPVAVKKADPVKTPATKPVKKGNLFENVKKAKVTKTKNYFNEE